MHFSSVSFTLATLLLSSVVAKGLPSPLASVPCSLTATGKDDAPQFLAAVQACPTVTIPKNTTLNIQTRLNMTGISNKHISLQGTIKFNASIPYWTGNAFFIPYQTQITFWLLGGESILLDGGGTLDGSGQLWWDTFDKNSSLLRPITLTVFQAKDVQIQNIQMINSPEWHNLVNEGQNVVYNNITINSTSTSKNEAKNTDGWDIYRSDNVTILNSVIVNGDDCVSFKPNSTNILVENLDCTGSHGISVGSLGQFAGVYDIVENVLAKNIKMTNAENGARIKAWAGEKVGSGIVKNITFQNFFETAVENPVIIDQCYETSSSDCTKFPSNTLIQDVWFNNITGTGTKSAVASLSCSPGGRCSDINVNDLAVTGKSGKSTYSCQNVNITGDSASLFPKCTDTS